MCRHTVPRICALTALCLQLGLLASCSRSKSDGAGAGSSAATGAPKDSPAPAGAGPIKLTVAAIPIVDVAPLYLGKQKGLFGAEGLELDIQNTQGGAQSVPCVVSGQCQFGFANVISLLLGHAKGLPLQVVAAGNFSTGKAEDFGAIIVPEGSPVKTMKDLEGKTLSVNQINNIGGVTVRAAMRKAGGDPDKIKFIEVPFPEMPAALGQKRVDAAWVVEPFLTVARGQGATVLDWNFADTAPTLMIAAYFTSRDYAQGHADVVQRFTAAMNKSLSYAAEHPDEARAVLLTYTKIDKAVTEKLNLPLWSPQIHRDSIHLLADLVVQDKLVPQKPDVDALLR
ncbi:MAG TPA: ABC transporter substrate-binding protein [Kofleriaceae bacterium]